MAEFITSGAVALPGSVGPYLREALPDDYIVVGEPSMCGQAVDAVVIGPNGMTILQAADAGGPTTPAAARRQESEARSITNACQHFMRDEFPKLAPPVRHFYFTRKDDIEPPVWQVVRAGGSPDQHLEDAITATGAQGATAWADEDVREEVAVALRDRRLTSSGRATKPFVFRSGGAFGAGTKVWTIRDAVRHMDRNPADGIYHLRNGTLAKWLDEEGAPHLARLARDAVVGTKADFRTGLETFLLQTGLVERPRLWFRPKVVDLGYVLEQESSARALHIRKGRGRGYLFGELSTSNPWLNTEPRELEGQPVEVIVSAETRTLPISAERYAAEVRIDSSASEEPVAVPVRLRVVATPSGMIRKVLRPANGLLIAGILGAALGWLWTRAGIPAPLPAVVAIPFLNSLIFWAVVVGAVWAFFGLIRGIFQPPAWPLLYALGRWLVRLLLSSAVLALLAVAVVWFWRLGLGSDLTEYLGVYTRAALVGAALGVIPASLSETLTAQRNSDPRIVKGRVRVRRWAAMAGIIVLLLAALLVAPRTIIPTWQRLVAAGTVTQAQDLFLTGWERANGVADGLIQQYYMKTHDRRAPAGPTATAEPTHAAPTPAGTPPALEGEGG